MPSLGRECPHPRCSKVIPLDMYACNSHWFALPVHIRNEIWDAYRAFLRRPSPVTGKALQAAQDKALGIYQARIDQDEGR